jgi:hypothetical protein
MTKCGVYAALQIFLQRIFHFIRVTYSRTERDHLIFVIVALRSALDDDHIKRFSIRSESVLTNDDFYWRSHDSCFDPAFIFDLAPIPGERSNILAMIAGSGVSGWTGLSGYGTTSTEYMASGVSNFDHS